MLGMPLTDSCLKAIAGHSIRNGLPSVRIAHDHRSSFGSSIQQPIRLGAEERHPPKFLEAEVPSGPAKAILKALPLPEVPSACSCFPSTFSLGDPENITNS